VVIFEDLRYNIIDSGVIDMKTEDNHNRSVELLSDFFKIFIDKYKDTPNSKLKILYSKKSVFLGETSPFEGMNHLTYNIGQGEPDDSFDLIFATPSFTPLFNDQLINSLTNLKETGVSFVILPRWERTLARPMLREKLKEKNLYVNAVIQLPDRFLSPDAGIVSTLAVITRKNSEEALFAEFEDWHGNTFGQFEHLIDSIISNILVEWSDESLGFEEIEIDEHSESLGNDAYDLWHGVYANHEEFRGFIYWKLEDELNKVNSDYRKFSRLELGMMCSDISYVNAKEIVHDENPNCLFMPLKSNDNVFMADGPVEFEELHAKLIVKPHIIKPEYLCTYLNSQLGKMTIDSMKYWVKFSGPPTKNGLRTRDIQKLEVRLPEIEIQNKLSTRVSKINTIHKMVSKIKSDIELHPLTSKDIDKIDDILRSINDFTIEDRLKNIINLGEGKRIEFKESLSLDKKTKTKNKVLEHSCLKTIAAFLNSEGGDLLIGVSDKKEIIGLEEEIEKFHKTNDKFLLHLKNLIQRSIGEKFYAYVDYDLIKIENKYITHVNVKESDSEVFLDGDEFFVRSNPSTDRLEGQRMIDYVKRRFQS
jgi:hypothetical protein